MEYSTEKAIEEKKDSVDDVALPELEAFLNTRWQNAKDARDIVHDELVEALRQRKGEYPTDVLTKIKEIGGSEIFMKITETKCRALESWLRDLLMAEDVIPWDIKPTPIPKLPKEEEKKIKQSVIDATIDFTKSMGTLPTEKEMELFEKQSKDEMFRKLLEKAKESAEKMKRIMDDQLIEGGYMKAFDEFIGDLSTFKCAFIQGPILKKKKYIEWDEGKELKEKEKIIPCWERVSPFDVYPQSGITDIEDGYAFIKEKKNRQDVYDMIGVPGYDEEKIRDILEQYDNGEMANWIFAREDEFDRESLENKEDTEKTKEDYIYTLTYWGTIPGKFLKEWGHKDIEDEEKEYEAYCVIIGDTVVKAELNPWPIGLKPFVKTGAYKIPGSFWHSGVPEQISDMQKMCNTSARELQNNMSFASGPIVEINIDKLPEGEKITQMYPRKIIQTISNPHNDNQANAVRFFQPSSNVTELLTIYRHFEEQADVISGIPRYIQGDTSVGGAGRTASGLSMLMGAASKGIRQIISYIDKDIIMPSMQRLYVFNMLYNDNFESKGDSQIVARGATVLTNKEQNTARKLEFLQMTANQIDYPIIGPEGRAAILRDVAKTLEMDTENIVPSKEQMRIQGMAEQTLAAQQQAAGQAQGNKTGSPKNLQPDGSEMGKSSV